MRGIVSDTRTRKPVQGASVSAIGKEARAPDVTDRNGRFDIELVPGIKPGDQIRLRVEKEGYKPYDEKIVASEKALVQVPLEAIGEGQSPKLPASENHGTTDKVDVKKEHPGTSDSATAKVEHPESAEPMKDLGVHSPTETTVIPPNSRAVISPKPLTPEQTNQLSQSELAYNRVEADPENMTLHDLYLYDFSKENNTVKIPGGWVATSKAAGASLELSYYVVLKIDSNSKYLQFFVPFTQDLYTVCSDLSEFYSRALNEANEFRVTGKGEAGDSTLNDSRKAVFTGRIFVYSEANLGAEDLGKLTALYESKNLKLQFRSDDYLENQKLKMRLKRR